MTTPEVYRVTGWVFCRKVGRPRPVHHDYDDGPICGGTGPLWRPCTNPDDHRPLYVGKETRMTTELHLAQGTPRQLRRYWTPEYRALVERALWIEVMVAQRYLGLDIPKEAIHAYEDVKYDYDHARALEIERTTRHDLKARLEHFNEQAGHEKAHLGMTSADVVDNVSIIRLRDSIRFLGLPVDMPFRGIKGPVGTQQDQVDLLGAQGAIELDRHVATGFGFPRVLDAVGQVYPRSLEYEALTQVQVRVAQLAPDSPYYPLLAGYVTMMAEAASMQWNEGDVSQSVIRRVALPNAVFAAWHALN